MINLSGRIAVITGASSGIGRHTSKLFARLGAQLSLVGRSEDGLDATKKLCIAEGLTDRDIICVKADLLQEKGVEKIAKETIDHFKTMNILVNNAGHILRDSVETINMMEYDRVMNVNCRSIIHLTHLFTPYLIANKGSVVNVSSVNAIRSFAGVMSYCISKAAVDQFTRCAALDLAPKGVRVNSVNPGVTVTELHKRMGMSTDDYAAFLERSKTTHALGRAGDPDEVAQTIAFLASDAASFITGVSLPVDGGRHALCPR